MWIDYCGESGLNYGAYVLIFTVYQTPVYNYITVCLCNCVSFMSALNVHNLHILREYNLKTYERCIRKYFKKRLKTEYKGILTQENIMNMSNKTKSLGMTKIACSLDEPRTRSSLRPQIAWHLTYVFVSLWMFDNRSSITKLHVFRGCVALFLIPNKCYMAYTRSALSLRISRCGGLGLRCAKVFVRIRIKTHVKLCIYL